MAEDRENPADINELRDNFSRQQKKISILKELVRNSENAHSIATSSAQEKVKIIAERLTNMKSKAIKGQKYIDNTEDVNKIRTNDYFINNNNDESSEITVKSQSPVNYSSNMTSLQKIEDAGSSTTSLKNLSTGTEKINLLRQQMEENKILIARRANSKQHLEQLVTQLKEKFDSAQQILNNTSELGKSLTDLSAISGQSTIIQGRYKSATDVSGKKVFSLDRERTKFFENRCRLLEKQLDNLKQHNSLITTEMDIKKIEEPLKEKIEHLENKINFMKYEFGEKESIENNLDELDAIKKENKEIYQQLEKQVNRVNELEELNKYLESTRLDLSLKIEDLNCVINNMNESLTSKEPELPEMELEILQSGCTPSQSSVLVSHENISNAIDLQIKAEMAKQIQELSNQLESLHSENKYLKEKVISRSEMNHIEDNEILKLNKVIENQQKRMNEYLQTINKLEDNLMEKTIELNVLNANFKVLEEKLEVDSKNKPLFSTNIGDNSNILLLENEVQQLKVKLDESNKAMIKMKLKLKQTEKQMETLNKESDFHGQLVKLNKKIDEQQQIIAELEDEKGQWQLTQVDKCEEHQDEDAKQIILKLKEINHNQEEEIMSLKKKLNILKKEIHEETVRVKSELTEVKLEEELDHTKQTLNKLEAENSESQIELKKCLNDLNALEIRNMELDRELQKYIQDNIDLRNKLEKFTKSSSSAESIEIVDGLTEQEQAEINENYEKQNNSVMNINEIAQSDISPELNESLVKLRDESAELMNKIELFTTERREVLEKMEYMSNENADLLMKIEKISDEKNLLKNNLVLAEKHLSELRKEKDDLSRQSTTVENKSRNSQELNSMHKSTEIVPCIDLVEGASLFDKCEKSLFKLNSELEAYRKANDKNSKFNVSKKLAKEAKNAHTQLSELLQKVRESSTAVETVTVVETVVAVTAANGEALAEYEQLTEKNKILQNTVNDLKQQLEETEKSIMERNGFVDECKIIKKSETKSTAYQSNNYEIYWNKIQTIVDKMKQTIKNEIQPETNESIKISPFIRDLSSLQEVIKDLENILESKDIAREKDIENITRDKHELEAKCATYDTELQILQSLVEEQKHQLIESLKKHENEISMKLQDLKQKDEIISSHRKEIAELSQVLNKANCEGAKMLTSLETNKSLLAQQLVELSHKQETIDELNNQLIHIYKSMEETNNKYIDKSAEVSYLQEVFEVKSMELEQYRKENEEQKEVVKKLLSELQFHKTNCERLPELENELQSLQQSNKKLIQLNEDLEHRNIEQLEKLKKYAINLKKRTAQYQELEKKIQELGKVKLEKIHSEKLVKQIENEKDEIKQNFESKINELKEAHERKTTEYLNALDRINYLEEERNELRICLERKEETIKPQNDEIQIELLKLRNEEYTLKQSILEKEKKISYLQQEVNSYIEKESNSTDHQRIDKLNEELKAKSLKFEKCKTIIKDRNNQIQRLQTKINELQEQLAQQCAKTHIAIQEIKTGEDKLISFEEYDLLQKSLNELQDKYHIEKSSFLETISRLNIIHEGIQSKLEDDVSYIDSLEKENKKLKEKIFKMEECIASYEQRHANIIDEKMVKREYGCEKTEDELVYRLKVISDHADVIVQRLLEVENEKELLEERVKILKEELNNSQTQNHLIQTEYQNYKLLTEQSHNEETMNLNSKIIFAENEIQKLQSIFDAQLASKTTELDELKYETSAKFNEMCTEYKTLRTELDESKKISSLHLEEIVELRDTVKNLEQLNEELGREVECLRQHQYKSEQDKCDLQNLRIQSTKDKAEIENLKQQKKCLLDNHEIELKALRTQISEFDALRMQVSQNRTDDQVFLETENKRLSISLGEKDVLIENYRERNLQLENLIVDLSAKLSCISEKNSIVQQLPETVPLPSDNNLIMDSNLCVHLQTQITNNDKVIITPKMFFSPNEPSESPFDDLTSVNVNDCAEISVNRENPNTVNELQLTMSDLQKYTSGLDLVQIIENKNEQQVFDELENKRQLVQIDSTQEKRVECKLVKSEAENLLEINVGNEDNQLKMEESQELLKEHDSEVCRLKKGLETEIYQKNACQISTDQNDPTSVNAEPSLTEFFGKSTSFDNTSSLHSRSSNANIDENFLQLQTDECALEGKYDGKLFSNLKLDEDWNSGWDCHRSEIDKKNSTHEFSMNERKSLIPREQQLEIQIQEYNEKIQELQNTLSETEKQNQDLQLKFSKIMRKFRELKKKYDELQTTVITQNFRKSSSIESNVFNDLDAAIQEEFQKRISLLEAKINEYQKLYDDEVQEKLKLLKRIESFAVGNEKYEEQLHLYKSKIRELQENLKSFKDWDSEICNNSSISNQICSLDADTGQEFKENMISPTAKKDIESVQYELTVQEITNLQQENSTLEEKRKSLESNIGCNKCNEDEYEITSLRNKLSQVEQENDKLKDVIEVQHPPYIQGYMEATTQTDVDTMLDTYEECSDYKTELIGCMAKVRHLEDINKELITNISDVDEINSIKEKLEIKITEYESKIGKILKVSESYDCHENDIFIQLQEKDSEILHLKQRIEDLLRDDQTEKLVIEILAKNQEIQILKLKVRTLEDDKKELESNISQSRIIPDIINDLELKNAELTREIEDLKIIIDELKNEKLNMETDLKRLNIHVLRLLEEEDSALQIDTKNIAIEELRKSIELLTAKADSITEAMNSQWATILEQKCIEITKMWEDHMRERETQFKECEQRLENEIEQLQQKHHSAKLDMISDSSTTIINGTPSFSSTIPKAVSKDSTLLHTSYFTDGTDLTSPEKIIEKMQSVLENQEVEIVTLKEQLAIRSAEYARLASQYDPFKLQKTLSHSGVSTIATQDSANLKIHNSPTTSNDSSSVSKSELDFALYMWHQRDMRCEELTLELVSLLEERDTLQLKLSNTIRQVEQMKQGAKNFEHPDLMSNTMSTTSQNITDPDMKTKQNDELNQKLSQLQTVNHSKDKIIQEDREHHIRQMQKIQQDVAKIPPDAVCELVGTNLSQTSQSPSSVLLNWLWGKKRSDTD